MLDISKKLLYYKRRDIQEAIVKAAENREAGTRFGDNGYGKRPDILSYGNDIIESVKNGATSFHISEERWHSPMQLSTDMKKEELNDLRSGWDLVLDIDCPYWQYSKLTTYLFIKALKRHGIEAISCKFSGNKGFHIGVPFESFPDEINNISVKNWFPDGPKKIALYLVEYIANNFIEVTETGEISFDNVHKVTRKELSNLTGKTESELSKLICVSCKKKIERREKKGKNEFVCPRCTKREIADLSVKFMQCSNCNTLMEKFEIKEKNCPHCGTNEKPREVFDALSIVDVDTILISSRHMFRAPYSLHEKSGMSSMPIQIGKILTFEKKDASPETINVEKCPVFLDKSKCKKDEARNLMIAAFDFGKEDMMYKKIIESENSEKKKFTKFEEISTAIPVELFPPCMLKILEGLEDGKKRSLFILTNFLTSVGWNNDKVEELLLEWNKKNRPSLREGDIKGQVRYHKQRNKKILPPNCRSYYQDFGVCFPDNLCDRIKNPVQYSKRRAFMMNNVKGKRAKLTDEQKDMRKQHRENLKKPKTITK